MKFRFPIVWGLLLGLGIALVTLAEMLPPNARSILVKEDGIVETLTAISYVAAAVLLLWQTATRHRERWSLFVVVACMGMREMDFHKRFTTMSIFKSRFFSSSEVPMHEKVVGVLVTLALLACIFMMLKRWFLPFIKGLRQRNGIAWSVFGAAALLGTIKTVLDGLARKLEPLGIEVSESVCQVSGSAEEVFELVAAMLLLVAVAAAVRVSASSQG